MVTRKYKSKTKVKDIPKITVDGVVMVPVKFLCLEGDDMVIKYLPDGGGWTTSLYQAWATHNSTDKDGLVHCKCGHPFLAEEVCHNCRGVRPK